MDELEAAKVQKTSKKKEKRFYSEKKSVSLHCDKKNRQYNILLWSHKKQSMMPGNLEHRE